MVERIFAHIMSLARFVARLFRRRKPAAAPLEAPNLESALRRLKARDIAVSSVIDVGASNGCWSEALLPHYPDARYLCVEAQAVHEPALRSFVAHHANAEFVLAAAGGEEGSIYLTLPTRLAASPRRRLLAAEASRSQ